jgi:hypothetical protein
MHQPAEVSFLVAWVIEWLQLILAELRSSEFHCFRAASA